MAKLSTASVLLTTAIVFAGCGKSTSFQSVPAENVDKSTEAGSADANNAPGESGEDANASAADPGATTVVDGNSGNPAATTDAVVMTVSIDDGSGVSAGTEPGVNETTAATGENVLSDTSTVGPVTDSSTTDTSASSTAAATTTVARDNQKVMSDCSALTGTPTAKIKVISSKNAGAIIVRSDEILLIHASGNRPVVKITTANGENAKVKGICIFAAGNHAQVEAIFGMNVGIFSYFGTGNMSTGRVTVGEEVVIDQINVKLRGNQAMLTVSGDGDYKCAAADLAGKKTSYLCGK